MGNTVDLVQNPPANEYVSVMVPVDLVPMVYRLIGERYSDGGAGSARSSDVAAVETEPDSVEAFEDGLEVDARTWSVEKLEKLAAAKYTTTKRLTLVMDCLAKRPGQPVPTSELVEATGFTRTELKAVWTKLTRHLNAHYEGAPWPVHAVWGPRADLAFDEVYYSVGAEQARRWIEARQTAA